MQESHRQSAEQHEMAARAHRTAAGHNDSGDNPTGKWHTDRALEYAGQAYKLAKEAHSTSGPKESF